MTLGEDQVIVVGVVRCLQIPAQMTSQQHGDEVGGGHRRGRVPGTGPVAHHDRVDTQLLREFGAEVEVRAGVGGSGHRVCSSRGTLGTGDVPVVTTRKPDIRWTHVHGCRRVCRMP